MLRKLVAFLDLGRRPDQGMVELHRRFGAVCRFGVGSFGLLYLLGPEANRFVLGHSELFGWREAFDTLRVVGGDTALILSDGDDHARRRRLVTPAFGRRQIDGYASTMRATADETIDGWQAGQVVDLYAALRHTIRRATIRVLFGPRLAADEPELGRLLEHGLRVTDRLFPWQQLQRLGAPSWRRAVAARAALTRRVQGEITHRRRGGEEERTDVLARLVSGESAELTDVEIIDQVISLIAAGYDTTSAAIAWAAHQVLADRDVAEQAAGSIDAAGWRYLDGVVSETLRLHPPAAVSARKVAQAFSFAGQRIPAGPLLVFSPYVTHRLPELWAEPLRFDPHRWDPDRPGYRRPAAHEFLPFGGGPHRCIGSTFATTQLSVLLEQLLRRTSLRLEHTDLTPVGLAAMHPRRGPIARVLAVR